MIDINYPNMISNGISKILFSEDFDEMVIETCLVGGDEMAVVQNHPSEPIFSLDQLQKENNQSYTDGVRAGQEKIESQLKILAINTFFHIEQNLLEIDSKVVDLIQNSVISISQLLMSTLSALFPSLCARHQASEITGLVMNVMGSMTHEPTLSISVAPEITEQLRVALCILSPEKSRRVIIVSCDGLDPGEAKISWQDGAASRNARRVQDAVTAILITLELLPPPLPLPQKFYPSNTFPSQLAVSPCVQQEMETANG